MIDILTETEIILRDAGFETWLWTGAEKPVACFENAALMGFVHVFQNSEELLARWEAAQDRVLARHRAALRRAGAKAWNVYSVFLTSDSPVRKQRLIERIEENFAQTRKIARADIKSRTDLDRALLPLLAVRASPLLGDSDFESRLRSRLSNISEPALNAFFGSAPADDVARILSEEA